MARNAAECEIMNAISRETGVPLFVAYYRRALPYFLKCRDLIHQGAIGEVRSVAIHLHKSPHPDETNENRQLPWRVIPEIAGGGHFHDLAAHQLDFLEFAFGPIKQAAGFARNQAGLYPADDCVVAAFEFETGALGSGNWCFTAAKGQEKDETLVTGSRGTLSFSFFNGHTITVDRDGGKEFFKIPYPQHVQQPLIEMIVSSLRGESSSPSTGLTGARASLWLDRITGLVTPAKPAY
jgi:predicted dehydrogenase